jgi:hypothetical protein
MTRSTFDCQRPSTDLTTQPGTRIPPTHRPRRPWASGEKPQDVARGGQPAKLRTGTKPIAERPDPMAEAMTNSVSTQKNEACAGEPHNIRAAREFSGPGQQRQRKRLLSPRPGPLKALLRQWNGSRGLARLWWPYVNGSSREQKPELRSTGKAAHQRITIATTPCPAAGSGPSCGPASRRLATPARNPNQDHSTGISGSTSPSFCIE